MLRFLPILILFVAGAAQAQLVEDEPIRVQPDLDNVSGHFGLIPGEDPPGKSTRPRIGPVGVTLVLDANGRPTQCAVVKSSGGDQNDRAGCAQMMAHRFAPGAKLASRLWQFAGPRPAGDLVELSFDYSKLPPRCWVTIDAQQRNVPAAYCKRLGVDLHRAKAMTDEPVYVPRAGAEWWLNSGNRR